MAVDYIEADYENKDRDGFAKRKAQGYEGSHATRRGTLGPDLEQKESGVGSEIPHHSSQDRNNNEDSGSGQGNRYARGLMSH